ncbi:MAG: stage sporulation protein [Ilumatobacteraceae bacterium]|nr:stage sporulation protein [Ilumatobacteraceae bacterium]
MATDRSPGEWDQAVRQQAAVAEIGQLGLRTGDLDDLLREAMVIVSETLEVFELALFELQPDRTRLRGRVGLHHGQVVSRRRMDRITLPAGSGSLPGYTVEQGTAVASSALLADERFRALAPEHGVHVEAALAAPISWGDDPWGVFVVYDVAERNWTGDEIHFVQSTANTMGLAIQRAGIERELRDSSTRLDLSLSAGGLGAWSWDLEGDRLLLNSSALAMYGLAADEFTGRGLDFIALIHPEDRDAFPQALDDAGIPAIEQHRVFRIIRPDTGELRWIEVWGRLLQAGSPDLHLVGVCSDVTVRRIAEEEQAAILEREHEARLAAERARERLGFLAEASTVLSSSLDPAITLLSLGELCVPNLADICFIDLIGDDGFLRDQVALGSTEVKLHDAQLLRKRRRELGDQAPTSSGHIEALGGNGLLYHSIDDEQLVAAAVDAAHLALFRRLDARSTIMAPLVARGRVIGVITLVRCGEQKLFDDDDLAMVEELAARAALATDNGRLFDSRNRVARSLQEALLPPAMPVIDGLALAARYDVAEADVAIGGDFYDVMLVSPGEWGVVVGDVCGRGPDAAALTGLVRHTLRSAVVREQIPSRVLGQTNQAMLQQIDDARFCTAAYLRVELGHARRPTVRISASSAGHPRPVLVRADGRAEVLDCAGTLLGVVADPVLRDVHAELGPGDAVVLYTDGVTEARRGGELFGETRLVEVLASLAGQPAEAIASGLEAAVTEFRRSASDDTAILVVQAVAPA